MLTQPKFYQTGAHEIAELSDADQDEPGKPITVRAYRFSGNSTTEAALVIAGVHSRTEREGVKLAEDLVRELGNRALFGFKPRFSTVVIPQLFDPSRYHPTQRLKDRQVQLIDVYTGKPGPVSDTNRNFPQRGESYAYVRARASQEKAKSDRAMRVKDFKPYKIGPELACECIGAIGRMMAENRILVQLIEYLKPIRIASIHQHLFKPDPVLRRGDEPGIFVDPRGGFNEHTDKAYTDEGITDDNLATDMFNNALVKFPIPYTDGTKSLSHPLRGNTTTEDGKTEDPTSATVHYSFGAIHDKGTSLGGWAPWPQSGSGPPDPRPSAPVITIELPRGEYSQKSLDRVKTVYLDLLLSKFLEVSYSP